MDVKQTALGSLPPVVAGGGSCCLRYPGIVCSGIAGLAKAGQPEQALRRFGTVQTTCVATETTHECQAE